MINPAMRSPVVLMLLLGAFVLALPYVSGTVDALFAPAETEKSTSEANSEPLLRPASPVLIPAGDPASHSAAGDESSRAPLAFDFQEEPRHSGMQIAAVQRTAHSEALPATRSTATLQQELQQLGATYLVVEEDGAHFECRALFPLSAGSSYQKTFSALGTSPEGAMEKVLAEAATWQRRR